MVGGLNMGELRRHNSANKYAALGLCVLLSVVMSGFELGRQSQDMPETEDMRLYYSPVDSRIPKPAFGIGA